MRVLTVIQLQHTPTLPHMPSLPQDTNDAKLRVDAGRICLFNMNYSVELHNKVANKVAVLYI